MICKNLNIFSLKLKLRTNRKKEKSTFFGTVLEINKFSLNQIFVTKINEKFFCIPQW